MRGKGTKLGEGGLNKLGGHCSKVRLSQYRMPILKPEGKGTKLGEGIRNFYVRDYYHFRDSGFLRSGLFRSGKVRGTLGLTMLISLLFSIVDVLANIRLKINALNSLKIDHYSLSVRER